MLVGAALVLMACHMGAAGGALPRACAPMPSVGRHMAERSMRMANVTKPTATWGEAAVAAGATLGAVALLGPSRWVTLACELGTVAKEHSAALWQCAPAAVLGLVCAYTAFWIAIFGLQQVAFVVLVEGWPGTEGGGSRGGWRDVGLSTIFNIAHWRRQRDQLLATANQQTRVRPKPRQSIA